MEDRYIEDTQIEVVPQVVMNSKKSEHKSMATKLAPLHEDHYTNWLSMNKSKSPHKQQKVNSVLLNINDDYYKKPKVINHSINTFDFKDNQSIGSQRTFASSIKRYHSRPLKSSSSDKITLGRGRLHTMSKYYPFRIKNYVESMSSSDSIHLDTSSVSSLDSSLSQINEEYLSTFQSRKYFNHDIIKQQQFTNKLDSSNDFTVSKSKGKLNSMIDEISRISSSSFMGKVDFDIEQHLHGEIINQWKGLYNNETNNFKSIALHSEIRYLELKAKDKDSMNKATKLKATVCSDLMMKMTLSMGRFGQILPPILWELLNCIYIDFPMNEDLLATNENPIKLFHCMYTYFEKYYEQIETIEDLRYELSMVQHGVKLAALVKKFNIIKNVFNTSAFFHRDVCFKAWKGKTKSSNQKRYVAYKRYLWIYWMKWSQYIHRLDKSNDEFELEIDRKIFILDHLNVLLNKGLDINNTKSNDLFNNQSRVIVPSYEQRFDSIAATSSNSLLQYSNKKSPLYISNSSHMSSTLNHSNSKLSTTNIYGLNSAYSSNSNTLTTSIVSSSFPTEEINTRLSSTADSNITDIAITPEQLSKQRILEKKQLVQQIQDQFHQALKPIAVLTPTHRLLQRASQPQHESITPSQLNTSMNNITNTTINSNTSNNINSNTSISSNNINSNTSISSNNINSNTTNTTLMNNNALNNQEQFENVAICLARELVFPKKDKLTQTPDEWMTNMNEQPFINEEIINDLPIEVNRRSSKQQKQDHQVIINSYITNVERSLNYKMDLLSAESIINSVYYEKFLLGLNDINELNFNINKSLLAYTKQLLLHTYGIKRLVDKYYKSLLACIVENYVINRRFEIFGLLCGMTIIGEDCYDSNQCSFYFRMIAIIFHDCHNKLKECFHTNEINRELILESLPHLFPSIAKYKSTLYTSILHEIVDLPRYNIQSTDNLDYKVNIDYALDVLMQHYEEEIELDSNLTFLSKPLITTNLLESSKDTTTNLILKSEKSQYW